MSLLGKLLLALSGVSMIIMVLAMWVLGAWVPVLYVPLGLFVVGFVLALCVDFRLYVAFFCMRPTRRGLSIGVSLVFALILCFSLAYLSLHFEKSLDVTEEKINTLSPQTLGLLKTLTENMTVRVFYREMRPSENFKERVKDNIVLYKKNSSYIRDVYHNAYKDNTLTQSYLNSLTDGQRREKENAQVFVFVEYKGKKALVDPPFNEEKLTAAMIRVTRLKEKSIYVLSGHGERDMESVQASGLSFLKEFLVLSSFQVKVLNFTAKEFDKGVPSDAHALILPGPQRPFLPKEREWLKEYLQGGGKLLAALDPNENHNLSDFFKEWGLTYKGHYLNDMKAVLSMGLQGAALGSFFDTLHPITSSFQSRRGAFCLFYLASPLETAQIPEGFKVSRLVKTDSQSSFALTSLKDKKGLPGSYTTALLLEGENPKEGDKPDEVSSLNKKMKLALFGDSDFMSNQFLSAGLNRDLVMNTISYLVEEDDLVSIRPRQMKATSLTLTLWDRNILIVFSIAMPALLFILAALFWFRRLGA